jgi:hypothetical protein
MKPYQRLFESAKKKLAYEFKCTDADEDGVFSGGECPFGEIDTNEFAEFIQGMEKYEISREQFENNFILPKGDKVLNTDPKWLQFYAGLNGETDHAVVFDSDVHFIYKIL